MLSLVEGSGPASSLDSQEAAARQAPSLPRGRSFQNLAVAVAIVISAVLLYQRFLPRASSLWYSPVHDRNGHYRRSQGVAYALRQGSLVGVLQQIHAATVWPPLHPLLTGVVLAIGGIDYRRAVLLSLVAWVATCWIAFALARRLAPRYKGLAGGVALLLTLASPAHRAYATDIMLESLGAAFTLGALHFYVIARQEGSAWAGRCFALSLLALFLTKYNYWTLLAIGLILATFCEFRSLLYYSLSTWWRTRTSVSKLCSAQLRHPLTYLLSGAFALACYVRFVGPVLFTMMGRRVEIETLNFPAQLCFMLLLLRVLPWWWRSGRQTAAQLPVPARQLITWHLYPLALWFLWPRRLGVFLWYVTFTQHGRSGAYSPWSGSCAYYWQCLANDYHATLVSLVVVLVLIALAVTGRRRPVGQFAVAVFLASAALLTNYHSANRSRFLHSWVAVGWVEAGVGAASIIERMNRQVIPYLMPVVGMIRRRRVISRCTRRLAPQALIWGALGGLACLQGPTFVQPGHSEEGGIQNVLPSLLPFADTVCPDLLCARRPVVVSDQPFAWLLDWRLAEYRDLRDRSRPSGAGDPGSGVRQLPAELLLGASTQQLDAWLQQTSADRLLLLDIPATPGGGCCLTPHVAGFHTWLASSGGFVLGPEWHFPAPLNITAQIWRRRATP